MIIGMGPTVYIETTIPSYLTAWPSRDLVRAGHQQVTREWWARRSAFDLYTSRLVVRECQAGDPTAAALRVAALAGVPLLEASNATVELAAALVAGVPLPPRAEADALHIATAAANGVRRPADVELHAHRQRGATRANRAGVPGGGVRAADDLHAGGIGGGGFGR